MPTNFTRILSIYWFYIPVLVKPVYFKPIAVPVPLKHTQLDSSIKLKKQFIQIKYKQNSSIESQRYKGIDEVKLLNQPVCT